MLPREEYSVGAAGLAYNFRMLYLSMRCVFAVAGTDLLSFICFHVSFVLVATGDPTGTTSPHSCVLHLTESFAFPWSCSDHGKPGFPMQGPRGLLTLLQRAAVTPWRADTPVYMVWVGPMLIIFGHRLRGASTCTFSNPRH